MTQQSVSPAAVAVSQRFCVHQLFRVTRGRLGSFVFHPKSTFGHFGDCRPMPMGDSTKMILFVLIAVQLDRRCDLRIDHQQSHPESWCYHSGDSQNRRVAGGLAVRHRAYACRFHTCVATLLTAR